MGGQKNVPGRGTGGETADGKVADGGAKLTRMVGNSDDRCKGIRN